MTEHQSLPASESYEPPAPNQIVDEPTTEKYAQHGYSIGYEVDAEGQPVPEGGNTAVFRISPKGRTEPVFVTKPEGNATFTVKVLEGQGRLIKATAEGQVEEIDINKGSEVVVRPGDAYSYANTSDREDLLLHDVAMPAFKAGDDVDLYKSELPTSRPQPQEGYSTVVARSNIGELVTVNLPQQFFDLLSKY